MMPRLIQGGIGIGVSSWTLAREVSMLGQLGVVSGTALDTVMIRRLAAGDPGGHMRREIAAFPFREYAKRTVDRYYRPSGSTVNETIQQEQTDPDDNTGETAPTATKSGRRERFPVLPQLRATLSRDRALLLMLANFTDVYLAKEDHDGLVGINYLHKIQLPILPSLYGAMHAGVDAVLIGAGIPSDIPRIITSFVEHEGAALTLDLADAGDERRELTFDPGAHWAEEVHESDPPKLKRPRFFAIVSSATLGRALLKKAPSGIDGLVVEAPNAGGHNAPPRGPMRLTCEGEPIHGQKDQACLAELATLGVPFWLAGGCATRERFNDAIAAGAHGIQIGTAFAFCSESGRDPALRTRAIEAVLHDQSRVFTDPAASPTNYPFKVVELADTISSIEVYERRPRLCDLGYLRRAYLKEDGTIGYRCAAEPADDYVRKGGDREDTFDRKCLCNALMSKIDLGQCRADGYEEPPLLTAGDHLEYLKQFVSHDRTAYSAREVVEAIL